MTPGWNFHLEHEVKPKMPVLAYPLTQKWEFGVYSQRSVYGDMRKDVRPGLLCSVAVTCRQYDSSNWFLYDGSYTHRLSEKRKKQNEICDPINIYISSKHKHINNTLYNNT